MENPKLGPGYSAKAFMVKVEQDDLKPDVWPGDFVVVESGDRAQPGDLLFTLDARCERPLRYYSKGQRKTTIMGRIIEVRSPAGSTRWIEQKARWLAAASMSALA